MSSFQAKAKQAIGLYKDNNLVWDPDLDVVRIQVANVLEQLVELEISTLEPVLNDLVNAMLGPIDEVDGKTWHSNISQL